MNKELISNAQKIRKHYLEGIPTDTGLFSVITSPFKVVKFKNVLSSNNCQKELLNSMGKLNFSRKDNDLYSFWQTDDLHNSNLKPIKNVIKTLAKEIAPCLSDICNVELNSTLDVTASLYEYKDMLLCHDDKCGDRCIAFVYYLTEASGSGGTFDMFDHDGNNQPTDIKFSLPPEKNSLVCFEVGNLTYHQVSEVTDEKFQRFSINGWFHSNRKLPVLNYEEPLPPMQQQISLKGLILLENYINLLYCTPSNLIDIQEQFEEESFVLLKTVFLKKFFNLCSQDVRRKNINWRKKGPANRRNYEVADLKNLPKSIKNLVKFLRSTLFVSYLKNISGLSLKPCKGEESGSEFLLELIRWTPGCYMMATDNDAFFKKSGLDLYLYFCSDGTLIQPENSSGYVTYLATDDDDSADKELITIVPEDNALALVYRTEDTVRFTKYINHSIKKEYYAIYATYYELDDG